MTGTARLAAVGDNQRLAARLRESGMTVYGFGERKTPRPFLAAGDKPHITVPRT